MRCLTQSSPVQLSRWRDNFLWTERHLSLEEIPRADFGLHFIRTCSEERRRSTEFRSHREGFKARIVQPRGARSEERRVGKECVSKVRSRGSPDHYKKKKQIERYNVLYHYIN